MFSDAQHCSFVLLADFDIDRGAQLTYQFPQPLGTDEGLLANLMLPDGAERQAEDWTIFFLNQTPFNTIAPALAPETPDLSGRKGTAETEEQEQEEQPELLYVLNLVRTKLDKTARRGAVVKAMAICTRHPFIQIFKPVLLIALEDYFVNPSQDCLARVFDAVNSMNITLAPVFTAQEKLILRALEQKDVFLEKYDEFVKIHRDNNPTTHPTTASTNGQAQRTTDSVSSRSSFDDGVLMRTKDQENDHNREADYRNGDTENGRMSAQLRRPYSPSELSFSLDGSAVWVGEESGLEQFGSLGGSQASSATVPRGRRSTDASSSSSHGQHYKRDDPGQEQSASSIVRDTHFFPATLTLNDHALPIRVPVSTFPEEVGDYSIIQLVQTFSSPNATLTGPLHPHLHTNGSLTHPIIVLFNALVTGKRIIFLGHHRPAGQVSSYVLSACALGSGCGTVLRGFIKRAFPYANLTNREEWESIPAYIAGVTNPIFESSGSWDLLCDVGSGRMAVSKDIHSNHPVSALPSSAQLITRTGTLKAEGSAGSEDDFRKDAKEGGSGQKGESAGKADHTDNIFMEDILSAISLHFGEAHVRARFTDYATRFVRLAARYEEEMYGATDIGFPTTSYKENPPRLGSGIVFVEELSGPKEVMSNASRIEAWRRTECYRIYQEEQDFQAMSAARSIQGCDLQHQIWRLRYSKKVPDGEVELIMRTIAENLETYEQVTELLSLLPPHHHGLLPLSFGLFHQQETIRDLTVDIFNELRIYPIGVFFLKSLNHFQRYAYVRQAHAREANLMREANQLTIQPTSFMTRTPSNRSESSLGGG